MTGSRISKGIEKKRLICMKIERNGAPAGRRGANAVRPGGAPVGGRA
ncbi:hypothetical protein BSIN_2301 [Burkholderia singularis]|uniref:Uncharacterized protein n=1 Tax=Burkholderia singularis TaxID=1503053 RepID=A0A238H1G1_9BURK|nr:hypothetical protein BSIN_2301 [Burkholderia singularis]